MGCRNGDDLSWNLRKTKEQVNGHCFKQNLPGGGDWSIKSPTTLLALLHLNYVALFVQLCSHDGQDMLYNINVLRVPHAFLPYKHLLKREVKFLFYCSQISAGAHVLTIGEPIGTVEVKVLTSQTQCTSSVECDTWPRNAWWTPKKVHVRG